MTPYFPSTADRSVSFSRDCQPGPPFLRASITSASRRTDTATFVGIFCLPRTRGGLATNSGRISAVGRILAICLSVRGGLSASISTFLPFITCNLPIIGFARADHPDDLGPHCENQNMDAPVDFAIGNKSWLTIGAAGIFDGHGTRPVKPIRLGKIDAVLGAIASVFRVVELKFRRFTVYTIYLIFKQFVYTK